MNEKKKRSRAVQRIPLEERLRTGVTMEDLRRLMTMLMSDFCEAAAALTGDMRYLELYDREIFPLELGCGYYFDLVTFVDYCSDKNEMPGETGSELLKKVVVDVVRDAKYYADLRKRDPEACEKERRLHYHIYLDQKADRFKEREEERKENSDEL